MRPAQNQAAPNALPIADQLQASISRVNALYGTKIDDISQTLKDGITNKFNEVNDNGPRAQIFVELLQEILDERERVTQARKEIVEKKIFKHLLQKTPQKISVKQELQEKRSVATPTEFELRNIMLESAKAQDMIDMNQQRLKSLLIDGRDISDEQKHKLATLRTGSETYAKAISRTAEYLGDSLARSTSKALNQVGRGIFSKGEAGKSKFVDEYRTILDERIKNLKHSIDPEKSKYAKILERMASSLKSSQDPLEIASCDSLCQMIQAQIDTENKEYKEAIDKLDKEVSDLTKEMMGKVQADIDKSDEQWKYRAMSMFLIFTPLGAFSIAGQVFNYLDPLVEIFGPIFEANKSLGEGFADAITSKQFGFLGQMMDKMEIDKAVETIIDKTPILSNFTEIINSLLDSEIAQNAGGQLAPMLDSPLTLIAIAASFSLSRAPAELDLMKSKRNNRMKYLGGTEVGILPSDSGLKLINFKEGDLRDKFKNFEDNLQNGWEKSAKGIIDKEFTVFEDSYIDCRAAKFFLEALSQAQSRPLVREAVPQLADLWNQNHFRDQNDNPNLNELLRHLNSDPQLKKTVRSKFIVIAALDNEVAKKGNLSMNLPNLIDEMHQLEDPNNPEKDKKIAKATENLKKDFYFDRYQDIGGRVYERSDSELERIKSVLKSQRRDFYFDNLQSSVPPIAVKPISANLLQRNNQQVLAQ